MQKPAKAQQSSQHNPYWISFSDLMSGLLLIFLLVCITLIWQLISLRSEFATNLDELTSSNAIRSQILADIKENLSKDGINVEIDNGMVLRIPEDSFHFDTDSHEITRRLTPAATSIGKVLYEMLLKDKRWEHLDTIFIEGHSDSRPTGQYEMGNWELSAKRAIALWKFWGEKTEYGKALQNLRNRDGEYLFSVSGYADTRRRDKEEANEEGMQKNRRIEIRFNARSPSLEEIKRAAQPLQGDAALEAGS